VTFIEISKKESLIAKIGQLTRLTVTIQSIVKRMIVRRRPLSIRRISMTRESAAHDDTRSWFGNEANSITERRRIAPRNRKSVIESVYGDRSSFPDLLC